MKRKERRLRFGILLVWPLIATAVSLLARADFIGSTVLFVGVPAALLTWWAPRFVLKAALFGLAFVPAWYAMDIAIYSDQQWHVVSAFSQRLPGNIAIEELPWIFLVQYTIVMFWEYFFDRRTREHIWSRRMTYLSGAFTLCAVGFILAWLWVPNFPAIPYSYLLMMLGIFLIPLVLELVAHPNLGAKFVRIGLYFGYLFFAYELVAVALGQWTFPSNHYIGTISFGTVWFPLEELVSVILVGAASCVAWYEHFDDDER